MFRISLHFDLGTDAKVTGKPKTLCLKTVTTVIFPKSSFLSKIQNTQNEEY